jgi:dipeptidyl-peptidase-4
MGTYRRHLWLPAVLLLAATAASAQPKQLTIDDIYDPQKKVAFGGHPAGGFVWIDGADYAWPQGTDPHGPVNWTKVDAATGRASPLFDPDRMQAALANLPGLTADDARAAAHSRSLVFDSAFGQALVTIADDLYVYGFAADRATRLTYAAGDERLGSFSPDGRLVAFVRDNNLFVVDVATARERPLTTDGADLVLNGRLDWVYEEEIYGRGKNQAYWWSPDSSRIAFLQIDDRPVSDFVTVDHIPYELNVEHWRYPLAGDPNPVARLAVVRTAGGDAQWIDTSRYSAADHFIVQVSWKPDSRSLSYAVQNRTQTWLDLNVADARSGESRTLLREAGKTWVDSNDMAPPTWLGDGSFLWLSERSGFKHAYHYAADGTLIGQVTSGRWELRELHGVDERSGWMYFSGTERSPIGGDVYRIRLNGTDLQRLSRTGGTHEATFSPTFAYYIDRLSDARTPPQVRLHAADGREVRVIDANPVTAMADYALSKPEFLQVRTRDGFEMEAELIRPPDFDPSRRYPVFQFTYGGPHAPMVHDAWGGETYMYHQLLAEHGIIVWICDNRTASGKGIESTWPLYHHFGELELRDIEDGLAWLKSQPWVDGSRIGLHGWSFGGFMTAYALTHSTSFAMGIAGGTVADWRDYDTVYTERYMGLPQENPDGYRASSPRWSAADLHGDLLLLHGVIDDNVHVQNTLQFAYELQHAQKRFEMMLYPKSRHGVTDPLLVKQMRTLMLRFTLSHLVEGQGGGDTRGTKSGGE